MENTHLQLRILQLKFVQAPRRNLPDATPTCRSRLGNAEYAVSTFRRTCLFIRHSRIYKMTARVVLPLLAVAFSELVMASDAAPLFEFTEKPGPYTAGSRVVEQYDYSRVSAIF